MASGTSPNKDKVILHLTEGETSSVIIANKVHSNTAYVNQVKNQLLQELLRSQQG
jgi:hypothetical protein